MDPALADPRPRLRATWARITGLVVFGATLAYVGLVDPATGGVYPVCPSRVLLGLDCPGCGGLRATHDLLHGDVAAATDHNLLIVPFLAVTAWLGWRVLAAGDRPVVAPRVPRWLTAVAVAAVVVFTVTRNLPVAGLEYLASDA